MNSTLIHSPFSWHVFFMKHAYLAASKSKDPRTKIGAVLVKNGIIVSEGFNGMPRGVKDYQDRYEDREVKYKFIVHGEANAILNAARNGINTEGTVCYTQSFPCHECTKMLIQAGIQEIYIHGLFPSFGGKWLDSSKLSREMLWEAKINVFNIPEKVNMKAYVDGKTVSV